MDIPNWYVCLMSNALIPNGMRLDARGVLRPFIPIGERLDAFGVPRTLGPFLSETQKVIAFLMKKFSFTIDIAFYLLSFREVFAQPIPRPPPLQIGGPVPAALWAGGHVYDDHRSNFFNYRNFYPFEPTGGFFNHAAPRWQPPTRL